MDPRLKVRGNAERGIEIVRCGAKRLISTCVEKKQSGRAKTSFAPTLYLVLCPRKRTAGASPHSVRFQSHALAAGALLTLAASAFALPAPAAPKENAAKDTVQVQTTLSGTESSSKESNLGDLVADAVRETGSAQVALVPADEISSVSIPAGKTDPAKIVSALHYADDPSDTVVVLTLTGAQLLKVAERSVSRAPEPFEGFLQVSGLQVRYNAGQPEGKRVSLVGVGGGEVDAGKTYKVAMPHSLAMGGLGYFQILTGKSAFDDTGTSLAKSLSGYLSTHPVVNSTVEDRITKN